MLRAHVRARIPVFNLWGLRFRSLAVLQWGLNKLSFMMTSALRLPLAHLPFIPLMTITTPLLLRIVVAVSLLKLNASTNQF
jgi:hypothetical protein